MDSLTAWSISYYPYEQGLNNIIRSINVKSLKIIVEHLIKEEGNNGTYCNKKSFFVRFH